VQFSTDRTSYQSRIEISAHETQGSGHNSIPRLHQDAFGLNDDRTAASHHTQHLHSLDIVHSSTHHGFPLPQRRRPRTLRRATQPKDSFPPPRGSSLVGQSLWLDSHAPSSIAANVGSPSHPHPVEFPVDSVDPHTRSQNTSHKGRSKSGGSKTVSKAVRHLADCIWSNACTNARGPSGSVRNPST
jgi:hypothetical protein